MEKLEVCATLRDAGLGEMTKESAEVREFEAYGDGQLNVVHVSPCGAVKMLDGEGEVLYQGPVADEDELLEMLDDFGHYAAC